MWLMGLPPVAGSETGRGARSEVIDRSRGYAERSEEGEPADEDLRGVQPALHVAKKMGTVLGRGDDLQ